MPTSFSSHIAISGPKPLLTPFPLCLLFATHLLAGCSSTICTRAQDLCANGQDFPGTCEGANKDLASCIIDQGDCSTATLLKCAGAPQMDYGFHRLNDGGLARDKSTSGDRAPVGDSFTTGEHEICDRYLACAAATAPTVLPGLQEGYGPKGSCWTSGPIDLCLTACRKGLSQLRAAAAGEPACRCVENSECLQTDATVCDPLNGNCGQCGKSSACNYEQVCHRSPLGTRCNGCGAYYPDNEVCGLSHAANQDLWSTAPACVFKGTTPTCVQCSSNMDCGGEICDLTTSTCPQQYPSCVGIWHCLRFAPMECLPGGDCCNQQLCPQSGDYINCMSQHCAACTTGDSCISCSVSNCQTAYKTCDNSCVS